MAQDHPTRLGSFALLPLPDVNGALEEISVSCDWSETRISDIVSILKEETFK
jgi:hypothetical protein